MNRHGAILDSGVNGAVSNGLDVAVTEFVNDYVRPLAQTLFPGMVGSDDASDFFAFTIKYDTSGGVKLAEHRDASVVTLNVNLNTPEEFASGDLKGSSLFRGRA